MHIFNQLRKKINYFLYIIFFFREKVTIYFNKTCIYLEGAGSQFTSIEWNDHQQTDTSATFTSFPDNVVAKGITFKVYLKLHKTSIYIVKEALNFIWLVN